MTPMSRRHNFSFIRSIMDQRRIKQWRTHIRTARMMKSILC